MTVSHIRKAVAALVAAGAILGVALTDGQVSAQEAVEVALAGLGALGVYTVRNEA